MCLPVTMTTQDSDNTEQPVREQLQKTTIAASAAHGAETAAITENPTSAKGSQGKPRKKRSFEDLEDSALPESEVEREGQHTQAKQHTRKRSRDSAADESDLRSEYKRTSHEGQREIVNAELVAKDSRQPAADRPTTPDAQATSLPADHGVVSPKTKRSRLQDGSEESVNGAGDSVLSTNGIRDSAAAATVTGVHLPQTSSSAFAASGFSSLASNASSGFGALGKKIEGGFGSDKGFASPSKPISATLSSPEPSFGKQDVTTKAITQPKTETSSSTFGGALGARSAFTSVTGSSAFGSGLGKPTAFGSSSGFGSLGGGAPLSSFAYKNGVATFGAQKAAKPFGAPAEPDDDVEADDDGDNEVDNSGVKSPISVGTEEDQKDARFYEQKVETGEEDEEVVYVSRAKLYNYTTDTTGKKEWRERGFGVLRLNVSRSGSQDLQPGESDNQVPAARSAPTARLLIRADGSHRVVLNSPIMKNLKFSGTQSGLPTNGQMSFMGTIDGKSQLELLQLKMRPQYATELYEKILELQEQME